jgi:hypothetical protein
VILRILHEFEGDWYCWSLTQNGKDPAKYIAAYRHVIDRFRAAGANNVRWMWCLNAEPKPYVRYNWVVACYPGDSYVDIVATDIYNHPDLGAPAWKSFRYTAAESYYYLAKYFAHKPLYICEVGCRERNSGEPAGSQSKGAWLCQMNADLRSYFSKVEALVLFNMQKEHDWRVQSSASSLESFVDCIWSDSYYGGVVNLLPGNEPLEFSAYPNPFREEIRFVKGVSSDPATEPQLRIYDFSGKLLFVTKGAEIPSRMSTGHFPRGLYFVEYRIGKQARREKLVKL